jgi:hypothetical protein
MKKQNYITAGVLSLFFLGMFLWTSLAYTPDYSDSERRVLASFPKFGVEQILDGSFAKDFDKYAVERFPARDIWRSLKAYASKALLQKDNNGLYTADGHISKLEYPANPEMMDHAASVMGKVYDKYLKNKEKYNLYLAVIPDKNRYLAEPSGHLSLDYDQFSVDMAAKADFAKYIEIAGLLDADDYYMTDSHWKQENILDVAEHLTKEMGSYIPKTYTTKTATAGFQGVYLGQSALRHKPDTIQYLTNDLLEQAQVEGAKAVYDLEKSRGKDPYELFLSGNQPVVTLKNTMVTDGKRLILFRDSFGSSLAPLMLAGYEEIVLVDLRYISSELLGNYVDFSSEAAGQTDVLFLYSTSLLNNALSMQ